MSKLFKHTVQPLGSSTSPVEDLALEVDGAFLETEKVIDTSETVVTSLGDTIGNPVFESLREHGVTKDFSEVHNMLPDESSIILQNIPEKGTLTLTYTDPNTTATVTLKEVTGEFTDKDQFRISGKHVVLNIRVPTSVSISVSATYRTKTFTLGGEAFVSNVLTKRDGSFELTPQLVSGNTYELDYEHPVRESQNLLFFAREGREYTKLTVSDYSVSDNKVSFTAEDLPSGSKVLVFSQNVSISTLLNALYKEFVEHTHDNENSTSNIDTRSLANRFINTDKINYKDDKVTNYLFPQYFNREGYNPNLDSVYENSILGDVFISRVISDTVQKFKGLDADSNALIFGDPTRGHKLRYSHQDGALVLNSLTPMDGLKVVSAEDKYGLVLNSSKVQSLTDGLRVEPEANTFKVKSKTTEKYTSEFDKVVSDEAVLVSTVATSIKFNGVELKAHSDNESLEVTSEDDKKVLFTTPVEMTKLKADVLESTSEVVFNSAVVDTLKLGNVHYKVNSGSVVITDEGDPKESTVTYNLPTSFRGRMTAHHISPTTINFGNIVFNVDEDTLGLNIFSTVPDQSHIIFKSLAKFTGGLEYTVGKGDLQIGEVKVQAGDDNTEVSGGELVFKNKVSVKNLHSQEDSEVDLHTVKIGKAVFGDVSLEKDETKLKVKGTGSVSVEVPTNLSEMTYNSLVGPQGSTANMDRLEVSSLSIGGVVISENGILNQGSPGATANPDTPGASIHFAAKLKADDLTAKDAAIENLSVNASEVKALKIGNGKLTSDDESNLLVTSETDGTKLKVSIPVEAKGVKVETLATPQATIEALTSTGITIGGVTIAKDEDNVEVSRNSASTVLELNLPVQAQDFTATNFATTNDATLKNIFATNITVNGVTWSSDSDGNSTISSEETKKFTYSIPVLMSNLRNTQASSEEYKLLPGDKIAINADNYITNYNGKFITKMTKGYTYASSGRDTGIKFALNGDAMPAARYYIASNTGGEGVESEKNAFIELDATDGLYILRSTHKKIQAKGTIYGFNDSTAPQNVSDLRRWLRAPLFSGPIEADSISLMVAEAGNRNGMSIGDTRISVIGPNTECPAGLTIFESGDSIHFVSPLAQEHTCRNLTYQEVNVGPIIIKGDATLESSITVTEDLLVGGTASATFLDITNLASMSKLKVSEDISVTGKAEFKNSVTVANDIYSAGNVVAKGELEGQNLRLSRDAEVQRDLRVLQDAYIVGDAVIEGSLSIAKGFQTQGIVKTVGVESESFKTHFGEVLTNFKVAGEHTVGGKLTTTASAFIGGNLEVKGGVEIDGALVAKDLYSIKDTVVREKLSVLGSTDLSGQNIVIGSDNSKTQVNGKLSINTDLLSINSPTRIFSSLKVSENAEFASEVTAKSGILTEAGISAKGVIQTESNLEVGSTVSAKSAEIQQDIRVGSSLTANNITSESIVIQQRGTIANLTISGSLTMPTDTTIVVGDMKANSFTQTNSEATSSFSGTMYVGKKLEAAGDVQVNGSLFFDTGTVQITSLGLKGKEAIIDVSKVRTETLTGSNKIQPPSNLTMSGNAAATAVASIISSASNFIRAENALFEGITVFAQPVVAGTIYYTDLIQVKEAQGSDKANSIDLTARRALYA